MQTNERQYWNILKGIGIVLVVLGHTGLPCNRYIYLFHLPLFFFVSGFLYNEEKYGDNPYLNIAARIKSSWLKCLFIYWILILLHNLIYIYQIWNIGTELYSNEEILVRLSKALLGESNELLGGTLWFVPVVVIANSLLGFVVTISRKVERAFESRFLKYFIQFIMVAAMGVFGYFMQLNRIQMMLHMQVVPLVMPFLWGGYLLKNSKCEFDKYLNPIVALICAVVLYFVSLHYQLELVFMLVYPALHFVAFLGIYMSMYFAKLIQKFWLSGWLFEWMGKASFWIMFIHFPNLILFDYFYTKYAYPDEPERYVQIMISYPEMWWVYLLVGLVLPFVEYVIYSKTKSFIHETFLADNI